VLIHSNNHYLEGNCVPLWIETSTTFNSACNGFFRYVVNRQVPFSRAHRRDPVCGTGETCLNLFKGLRDLAHQPNQIFSRLPGIIFVVIILAISGFAYYFDQPFQPSTVKLSLWLCSSRQLLRESHRRGYMHRNNS
jgi:hypothetical protein